MRGGVRYIQIPTPISLRALGKPFDDPNWIFEIKHDGFRALAVIEGGQCRFYSRNKHRLTGFRDLAEALAQELNVESAILDGELVAADERGRTVFAALMQRSSDIQYFAFDLLWLNGQDLRALPLVTRKDTLKRLLPTRSPRILYVDYTRGAGTELYYLACELDLEGIVAKEANAPYEQHCSKPAWIKIKNPTYSQQESRGELFKKVR